MTTNQLLAMLAARERENRERWKNYARTPAEPLLIATEELGEVARSMQERGDFYQWPPMYGPESYAELVDLGAVVLAMMLECPAE
jgi:NTP pyrophosphatase (non-canonical NTP hydrolase)